MINSSKILKKYRIKEPTLLKILTELNENGIQLDMNELSIDELVKSVKGIINEKHN